MNHVFLESGYPALENQMTEKLLNFNKDSVEYCIKMRNSKIVQGNFKEALNYALQARNLDSTAWYCNYVIACCYVWLEDYAKALKYLVKSEDLLKQSGTIVSPTYIAGYIYLVNGYEKEAEYHLNGSISRNLKEIEYHIPRAQRYRSHFVLAKDYAALGNEEKALAWLNELKMLRTINYEFINILIHWPGFESIRERPEFQHLLKHLEDKYQKQHKRIGKLIEDLEMNSL